MRDLFSLREKILPAARHIRLIAVVSGDPLYVGQHGRHHGIARQEQSRPTRPSNVSPAGYEAASAHVRSDLQHGPPAGSRSAVDGVGHVLPAVQVFHASL